MGEADKYMVKQGLIPEVKQELEPGVVKLVVVKHAAVKLAVVKQAAATQKTFNRWWSNRNGQIGSVVK